VYQFWEADMRCKEIKLHNHLYHDYVEMETVKEEWKCFKEIGTAKGVVMDCLVSRIE
jgi:hypothetical protein